MCLSASVTALGAAADVVADPAANSPGDVGGAKLSLRRVRAELWGGGWTSRSAASCGGDLQKPANNAKLVILPSVLVTSARQHDTASLLLHIARTHLSITVQAAVCHKASAHATVWRNAMLESA